jgi:hypothetical protein
MSENIISKIDDMGSRCVGREGDTPARWVAAGLGPCFCLCMRHAWGTAWRFVCVRAHACTVWMKGPGRFQHTACAGTSAAAACASTASGPLQGQWAVTHAHTHTHTHKHTHTHSLSLSLSHTHTAAGACDADWPAHSRSTSAGRALCTCCVRAGIPGAPPLIGGRVVPSRTCTTHACARRIDEIEKNINEVMEMCEEEEGAAAGKAEGKQDS